MPHGAQPAVHGLLTTLCAPTVAISEPDGQVRGVGAQGIYRYDRRSVARLDFAVDGTRLIPVGSRSPAAGLARFDGVVLDSGRDPVLRYVREREVTGQRVRESWSLRSYSAASYRATIIVTAASDLAAIEQIRSGQSPAAVSPTSAPEGPQWTSEGHRVRLRASEPADEVDLDGQQVRLTWHRTIPLRGSYDLWLEIEHEDTGAGAFLSRSQELRISAPPLTSGGDCDRLLRRSQDDLQALLLADASEPHHAFLAAGSPWYLTLFGRDALWAARLLLPHNVELATGTLRALAALQGTSHDPNTEEQPGKIPHERRRAAFEVQTGGSGTLRLPPLYYGTIDATALWVCLLYEAWRAGMAKSDVDGLLPALRAALRWIADAADPDGDGFCEYRGSDGDGLANQGWKDSPDGIRWADGTIARRPLALCEVQGYVHAALLGAAEVLDAAGDDGQPWRERAARLRQRFRSAFWVTDEHGRYPAVALDGSKRPVTGPASNMAHLLATGLLDEQESELVAEQLTSPGLDSGYGLRTMSARSAGFNPFSYHCGSVWPHDTAIAVLGLAAEGQHGAARALASGLLRAASWFDYRLPELFAGTGTGEPPLAYPTACSPQAWSAAAGVAVARYLDPPPRQCGGAAPIGSAIGSPGSPISSSSSSPGSSPGSSPNSSPINPLWIALSARR